MGVRAWLAVGAVGIYCLSIGWLPLDAHDATESRWLSDFEQALATARKERKPLFVVFRCEH